MCFNHLKYYPVDSFQFLCLYATIDQKYMNFKILMFTFFNLHFHLEFWKKFCHSARAEPLEGGPGSIPGRGLNFFQTSNFDSLQFCSQLTYRDPQYLFGKISISLKYIVSIQKTSRIPNIFFALSKWPHLHRAYLVSGPYSFSVPVCILYPKPSVILNENRGLKTMYFEKPNLKSYMEFRVSKWELQFLLALNEIVRDSASRNPIALYFEA